MRALILVLAVLLAAAVWSLSQRSHSASSPIEMLAPPPGEAPQTDLPKLWALPAFTLTDRAGHSVSLDQLKGTVWAADFFYTTCPGPCTLLSTGMSEVQKALLPEADARFVSISTDPENDTPEALQKYAEQFHAGEHWIFLTGDKAAVQTLANSGFKLSVVEENGSAERIIHSTKVALVDRTGTVRGFYDGLAEEARAKLIRDFRRLLREQP